VKVAVVIGSASDREAIAPCVATLCELGVSHEIKVLSAHRTPDELARYVVTLADRGFGVVVAAAGLAALLARAIAARATLPVIGVPLEVGPLKGLDALLATAQMPAGVPVAAMGIGQAGVVNAALLAAQIVALADPPLGERLRARRETDARKVLEANVEG
jgi:phosphoribosylaminoimidazole carboxylase PurE protein